MHGSDHAGEDAELYALGALDEPSAARVARHAAVCAACARRVGEAEATVARLIPRGQAAPLRRVPRFRARTAGAAWMGAVAAAFLLGLLPWGLNRLQPAPPSGAAVQAETAMLDGHFAHAPFVARTSGAPRGKVIYALRGGWLYVLATPGRSQLDVALKTAGTARVVASMAPSSLARSVFVRTAGRVESVDLLEHGRAVATASIVYAPQR